jgi:DNA repair protein RadD
MAYQLREYQQKAVNDALTYLQSSQKNGIMVLPTGAGKSLIIAAIARALDEPTLIFQPTKEILEQNFNKLVAYGEPPQIFSASFNSKNIGSLTLATIGSAINKLDLFGRFKYIIIDECHYVNPKHGMYKEFIEKSDARILGLTASPYRLVTDGFGGSILKFITRTRPRIFHDVIHVTQNGYLFDNGYLSSLDYYNINGFDSGKLKLNSTGADYTDSSVKSYYDQIDFVGNVHNTVSR